MITDIREHNKYNFYSTQSIIYCLQNNYYVVIEEFQYDIHHRSGSAHQNADGMSRRPCRVDVIMWRTLVRHVKLFFLSVFLAVRRLTELLDPIEISLILFKLIARLVQF